MMLSIEKRLYAVLQELLPCGIAFSGGADSTMLAVFAAKHFGKEQITLVHLCSILDPGHERELSEQTAAKLGIRLLKPELDPLETPEIRANGPMRCYYCKKKIMSLALRHLSELGISTLCDGTNTDDLKDYRPGIKAADELGIRHPFLEAELGKKEIRLIARRLGIRNWNLSASACLASRIPTGTVLEPILLMRIRQAEGLLTDKYHLNGLRVRLPEKTTACIEVKWIHYHRLMRLMPQIKKDLYGFGFTHVESSLYRQGAMNHSVSKHV